MKFYRVEEVKGGKAYLVVSLDFTHPEVEIRYTRKQLPDWIKDKLAVLKLLDYPRPGNIIGSAEAPGVGRRITGNLFWVLESNDDDTGGQGKEAG